MASEMGVLPIPEEKIVTKWRLQPGRMLLVDLEQGRIISDDEIKTTLAAVASLSSEWLEAHPDRARRPEAGRGPLVARRRVAARPPAGFRLHPGRHGDPDGADGGDRPGSDRLDGHRHADLGHVVALEAALQLFQAELRPGHQSADRPDPRGTGDEPRLLHRPAAQHSRPRGHGEEEAPRSAPADPDQRRSRKDPLDRPFRGCLRHQDARHHL